MDNERLEQLSKWMGFLGIITIIMGALQILSIAGAISGIIFVILGLKLRKAKQYADSIMIEGVTENYWGYFNEMVGNLNVYFKIQGILIIVSIVLGLLGGILALIFSIFFSGQFLNFLP